MLQLASLVLYLAQASEEITQGFEQCKKGHSLDRIGVSSPGWADHHCFACGGHIQPGCVHGLDTGKQRCESGHELRKNGLCYRCGGHAEPACTKGSPCAGDNKSRMNLATQTIYCYNCGNTDEDQDHCDAPLDLCPAHMDSMLMGRCVSCATKGLRVNKVSSAETEIDSWFDDAPAKTSPKHCVPTTRCKGNLNFCFRCGGHAQPACQLAGNGDTIKVGKPKCVGFLQARPNGPYRGLCMPPIKARHCTDRSDSNCLHEDDKSTSTCAHISCTLDGDGNVQVRHRGKEHKSTGHHCSKNLHEPWQKDKTSDKCGCDCYRKYVGDEDLFADILTLKAEKAMEKRAAQAFKEEMQMDRLNRDGGGDGDAD